MSDQHYVTIEAPDRTGLGRASCTCQWTQPYHQSLLAQLQDRIREHLSEEIADENIPDFIPTDPEQAIHDIREALGAGEEQRAIAQVGLELITMLLAKNRRYGSSATNPIRVFSKLDPIEGIHLRMDDKLSRIRAGAADDDEDPVWDLGGYCVLELVARRKAAS